MRFLFALLTALCFTLPSKAQDAQPQTDMRAALQAAMDQMAKAQMEHEMKLEALHVRGTPSSQTPQPRPAANAPKPEPVYMTGNIRR